MSVFYVLKLIKVQWITMVATLVYVATLRKPQIDQVYAAAATRRR